MRRLSAQYIITANGNTLKRGIILIDNKGRIKDIIDTEGSPAELPHTEFYNGIIVPGFVNCHCHLELSAMHQQIDRNSGLGMFLREIKIKRPAEQEQIRASIGEADRHMYRKGISACADICNTSDSFPVKENSSIKYINLLEVFGVDPAKADKRINEILNLKKEASDFSTPSFISPHSFYSMSSTLLLKVKELAADNDLSSVHYRESQQEDDLMGKASGELMNTYQAIGINPGMLTDRVPDHGTGLRNFITKAGNLILVHNTYSTKEDIENAKERGNCYFCLCPSSNLYIENKLPPVDLLATESKSVVLGTDSLASNETLDILEEIKIISKAFPHISLQELISWASINGARALGIDSEYGSIETGKTPGLVLIENADLKNLRLKPDSRSRRLA